MMIVMLPRLLVCTLDLSNPCYSVIHPRMAQVPPLAASAGLTVCSRRYLDRVECSVEDPELDADTFDRMKFFLEALVTRGIYGLTLELEDEIEVKIFQAFREYFPFQVRHASGK